MNLAVRIILYVVLSILAIWLGLGFARAYRNMSPDPKKPSVPLATNVAPSVAEAIPAEVLTNTAGSLSNIVSVATNQVSDTASTQSGVLTNITVGTSQLAKPGPSSPAPTPPAATSAAVEDDGTSQISSATPRSLRGKNSGVMMKYLIGLVAALIGLGLMLARDFSRTVGSKAMDFLFNDDAVGITRPEYDAAEQVWATGDFLDAIRLLREYYIENPREVFVAIRIAEIYEKDLKNPLAAALEYEEILGKSLPPARWSWTAIHLCNLYSKMGQSEKSLALLRRIAVEYGETPGAEKARKRLAQIDPEFLSTLTIETLAAEEQENEPEKSAEVRKDAPKQPNLPSGFRPRK